MALARALQEGGREALIVNADASQVYAGLPIVSAAPSPEDMAEIPHALFGYIDPSEACNAVRWAEDARRVVRDVGARGIIPILVGGTGMYIRTLMDGIAPIPEIDATVRSEVRAMTTEDAREQLLVLDPEAAARLGPRDATRIARALEVVVSTGRTLSDWQADIAGGIGDQLELTAGVVLPPRAWLRERCALRWQAMVDAGAEAEVAALMQRHLDPTLPAMRAIGVPELIGLISGTLSAPEAAERAINATRQYAKRQYTWFRNQPPRDWHRLEAELNDDELSKIVTLFQQSLLTH